MWEEQPFNIQYVIYEDDEKLFSGDALASYTFGDSKMTYYTKTIKYELPRAEYLGKTIKVLIDPQNHFINEDNLAIRTPENYKEY